jgi:hypothetical protein
MEKGPQTRKPTGVQPPRALPDRVTTRPELVFGLVGALGTDLDPLENELQSALRTIGYDSGVIRLSALIAELYERAHPGEKPSEPRMAELMRQGDDLRRVAGADAAVALGYFGS